MEQPRKLTWEFVGSAILSPGPDLLSQNISGRRPTICALTSPPGILMLMQLGNHCFRPSFSPTPSWGNCVGPVLTNETLRGSPLGMPVGRLLLSRYKGQVKLGLPVFLLPAMNTDWDCDPEAEGLRTEKSSRRRMAGQKCTRVRALDNLSVVPTYPDCLPLHN